MGDALKKVVSRAISDAAFRRNLQTNPKAALKDFNLSAAESAALTSGDPAKLTALGIDQRMSRMFTVSADDAGLGAHSRFDSGAVGYTHATARIDVEAGGAAGVRGDEVERIADSASASGSGDLLERHDSDPSDVLSRISDESGGLAGLGSHDDGAGSGAVDVNDVGDGGLPEGGAETPHQL
jgi:hypothetical protein